MIKDGIVVVDDFLTNEQFNYIINFIFGNGGDNIEWNFRNFITGFNQKELNDKDVYQFTNSIFYKNRILNEKFFNNIIPIFEKRLEIEHWLKIKMNFRPIGKRIETGYHTDILHQDGFMFLTAVFYLNSNNGYTEIINKNNEKIKVDSVENRCVIFRGDLLHQAVTSDNEHRFILNMNFLNSEVNNFYK